MILVLSKLQTFIQLHLLVVIAVSFVFKHSKYEEKILEMAEFIYYLSRTSPIFLNVLQSQIYNYFMVYKIEIPIIL